MLTSNRSVLSSSRSFAPSLHNSTQRIFQRYSSSSSDLTQNKLETKELEQETASTSQSANDLIKAPISTQEHTTSIESSVTSPEPSTQQLQPKTSTKTTKAKSARSLKSIPLVYRLPYVPSTQHLKVQDIKEDCIFQGFRPLLSPLRDQIKTSSNYSKSKPLPPQNSIAYWNTSACGHPLAPRDCVPKFIGDGMKAFKVPLPPGNEIRIRARAVDNSSSAKMRRFVKKMLDNEENGDPEPLASFKRF